MQITTIVTTHANDFSNAINKLLKEGWEFHGEPSITTNSHQDTWDGELRTWSRTTYVQVMKKKD